MYRRNRQFISVLALIVLFAGCTRSSKHPISQEAERPTEQTPVASVPVPAVAESPNAGGGVILTTSRDEAMLYDPRADIGFDEFRTHALNRTALIIDARSPEQFAQGHVRVAINIPVSQKEIYTERYLKHIDRSQLIIIYCNSAACHSSDYLLEYLLTQGFTNVRVFSQGWLMLAHARDLV